MKKTYISPKVGIDDLGTEEGILATSPTDYTIDVKGFHDDGVIQLSKPHSFNAFDMDDED